MNIGTIVWINCPVSLAHGHIGEIVSAGYFGYYVVLADGKRYRLHHSELTIR